MDNLRDLKCFKCGVPLEIQTVFLEYLGNSLHTELPACPVCGQVYMSEDMARTKALEVEQQFEEK
jgi:uncharacterized Zn finger protein (UPF0148 family)